MSKISLNVTAITFDKEKNKKLSFYLDGKISNTEKIDNILVSSDSTKDNFIYALSENMETVIENSQTSISAVREIKRYQKKLTDETFEERAIGFENSVKSTYDFIYGVEGDSEIEFSKDKLFTGLLIKDGKAKLLSTNYNSLYYISENEVINCFSMDNADLTDDSGAEDEGDYSPSSGVLKSLIIEEIKKDDVFIFNTQNVNSKLSAEIIADCHDSALTSEEIGWNIVNEANNKDVKDEMIILVIKVEEIEETAVKVESRSKFAGFFKPEKAEEEIEEEAVADDIEVEEEPHEEHLFSQHKDNKEAINKFTSIKFQNPGKMKRRMNIYIKRLISIVIVLILMTGIVWGMVKLFKLIIDNGNTVEVSATPTITPVETPVVSEEPTPTPSPSPTPTPTPTPTQSLDREHIVKDGDSLWAISMMYYNSADYIDDIVAYNENLTNANSIYVGQKIKIPFLNTSATASPSPTP